VNAEHGKAVDKSRVELRSTLPSCIIGYYLRLSMEQNLYAKSSLMWVEYLGSNDCGNKRLANSATSFGVSGLDDTPSTLSRKKRHKLKICLFLR